MKNASVPHNTTRQPDSRDRDHPARESGVVVIYRVRVIRNRSDEAAALQRTPNAPKVVDRLDGEG